MCGILGYINVNSRPDPETLERQLDTLAHRGPDDSGLWFSPDGCIVLGNRRLAIQDLSPAGHMPMSDPSEQVWITFNGEIYNFRALRADLAKRGHTFRSRSDTEVILAAYLEWGTDCLARLNGMFAFAIYDSRLQRPERGRLFLARDRAGEKPLYYRRHPNGFSFASELKALMADPTLPRRLNLHAFNAYLALGYVPGQMCILEGVKKLRPAHALLYDLTTGDVLAWRYWSLPEPEHAGPQDVDALVDELEQLLLESVKSRLVADVPVGIFLSGGIDSSLVTAMAARCSSGPVKTFTITFPGHGRYDESPHARRVAEWFSTDHHELVAEPAAVDLLPELAAYYDEPLADSSMVPAYLVSRLTRQHVTVSLGGDGGDELFGGYTHYPWVLRKKELINSIPRPIRALLASSICRVLPVGFRGRTFISSLRDGPPESMVWEQLFFDAVARGRLLALPVRHSLGGQLSWPERYMLGLWPAEGESVDQMTRLDFATYLPEDILVKVDRASMAVSLEVRSPFLDRHIIEFAFGRVPGFLKVGLQERKILPRLLAQRLLPRDLELNRKHGFSLPLRDWFKGRWGRFAAEVLGEVDTNLFNRRAVLSLLNSPRFGFSNIPRLFALTMFELWRRRFRVGL